VSEPTSALSEYLSPLPQRPTVTETLIQQILSLIREASLKPGDKLPSEKEVIEATNASRPSVREALRALKTMGIIETRPGAGSFLRQPEPAAFIRPEVIPMVLMGEGLRDILEARKVLECHVARLAARCDPDDLAPLEALLDVPESRLNSSQDVYRFTWAFHMALADIAGNPVMAKLVRILYEMVSEVEFKLYWPYVDYNKEIERHRTLCEAILRGEEEADLAMRDHIDFVGRVVERGLESGAGLTDRLRE
jgi:GntR family transcriptional repressor for pyruvate dehydrogenase complex